jgi:predicted CoA-binding protein
MSDAPNETHWQDPGVIRRWATGARTVAVVGLSPDPGRPSHGVAAYLIGRGLRVFGVNPAVATVLGVPCYPSLAEVPEPVDIVDVFRRSSVVPPVAEQAVAIGAGVLWLQLGVLSPRAARIAEQGGLDVVMDRCLAVEHRRLVPSATRTGQEPTVP